MSLTRDWRLVKQTPTKRILMRYCALTDEVEICEEFLEDAPLKQAEIQRDKPVLHDRNIRPLAVIPDSVMSRAINEGWINDQDQWAKWAGNADNRKLQLVR
jgi:hypothetical protein